MFPSSQHEAVSVLSGKRSNREWNSECALSSSFNDGVVHIPLSQDEDHQAHANAGGPGSAYNQYRGLHGDLQRNHLHGSPFEMPFKRQCRCPSPDWSAVSSASSAPISSSSSGYHTLSTINGMTLKPLTTSPSSLSIISQATSNPVEPWWKKTQQTAQTTLTAVVVADSPPMQENAGWKQSRQLSSTTSCHCIVCQRQCPTIDSVNPFAAADDKQETNCSMNTTNISTTNHNQKTLFQYFGRPTKKKSIRPPTKTPSRSNDCTFCERPACPSCTHTCHVCERSYCTFCSTHDYSGSGQARAICLDCRGADGDAEKDDAMEY